MQVNIRTQKKVQKRKKEEEKKENIGNDPRKDLETNTDPSKKPFNPYEKDFPGDVKKGNPAGIPQTGDHPSQNGKTGGKPTQR